MNINMKGMLLGSSSRLRNIIRFSNSSRVQDESVAEHSFGTALYCLVIGTELRREGLEIDVELAVKRALIHDIEESHSGDFIRTFKHSDKTLAKAIDKAADQFAGLLFKEMSPTCSDELMDLWKKSKEKTLEGMLVQFADFLSVVSYVLKEASMGNRSLMEENAKSMGEYANKFNAIEFDFMREHIKAAQVLLFKGILHEA